MENYTYLTPIIYTPSEIATMKADDERRRAMADTSQQGVNSGLNVANLGTWGSLGFLLGNLGGNWYQNYKAQRERNEIQDAHDKAVTKAYSNALGNYGQNAWWNQIQNQNNQWWKTPQLPNPNPQSNNYAFEGNNYQNAINSRVYNPYDNNRNVYPNTLLNLGS